MRKPVYARWQKWAMIAVAFCNCCCTSYLVHPVTVIDGGDLTRRVSGSLRTGKRKNCICADKREGVK